MMEIRAEMVGVVSQVHVKPGDRVTADQEIATMESMKMVIPVASPVEGTVREVRVQAGDFVQEGDVLVVLE
ncbi:MAG: acetyl-CoA carboxylase biotin carboxyl carrier protein subunit [Clostridia bacterium]|nr:acetyl-CoA carboxylase biotin carboxyl carrier protein subunit [Clostridia bacterium]